MDNWHSRSLRGLLEELSTGPGGLSDREAKGRLKQYGRNRLEPPKGESLANVGVTPDRTVEVDEETRMKIYYGTLPIEEDVQLEAALELLETE